MRFMVIVKANEDTETGVLPTEQELAEMGEYNEELVKAGVMLAGEGLHPSSKGARVRFDKDGKRPSSTARSPRPRSSSPASGSWRCPRWRRPSSGSKAPFRDGEVEIRQVFSADDFGDAMTPGAARAGGPPAGDRRRRSTAPDAATDRRAGDRRTCTASSTPSGGSSRPG